MTLRLKTLRAAGNLMVPMSSRADATAALSLYPACKWRGRVAQRLALFGVLVLGPRVLPGAGKEWSPPCGEEVWELLASAWRRSTPFDSFGVHLRRPLGRDGFSVLLIESGEPKAFVKIRRSPSEELRRELAALEALRSRSNPVFLAPEPLDKGSVDGWEYLMLSPLPPHIHTVVRSSDSLRSVVEEIQSLGPSWGELGRRRTLGWVPIHGDLTPWNLRLIGEQVLLYDWESPGWGPPGADLLWYDVAIALHGLRMPLSGAKHTLESYAFWLEEVETVKRPEDVPDPQVVEYLRRGVSRLRSGSVASA